jgi:PRTRC genetic system protein C
MSDTTASKITVKRRFVFNGMVLDDPDPGMTPMKVAEFYSLLHAELTNVTVKGPTRTTDGFDEYKFTAQVGTFN